MFFPLGVLSLQIRILKITELRKLLREFTHKNRGVAGGYEKEESAAQKGIILR